jgi:hypothetical protein
MGAFDSVRVPVDSGYSTVGFNNPYDYFSNQSSFSFFAGFGIDELNQLLVDAEDKGSDMLWVPQERKGQGRIGLNTWYVRALIKQHFGVEEAGAACNIE